MHSKLTGFNSKENFCLGISPADINKARQGLANSAKPADCETAESLTAYLTSRAITYLPQPIDVAGFAIYDAIQAIVKKFITISLALGRHVTRDGERYVARDGEINVKFAVEISADHDFCRDLSYMFKDAGFDTCITPSWVEPDRQIIISITVDACEYDTPGDSRVKAVSTSAKPIKVATNYASDAYNTLLDKGKYRERIHTMKFLLGRFKDEDQRFAALEHLIETALENADDSSINKLRSLLNNSIDRLIDNS